MRNYILIAIEIVIFCAFLYSMNCFWFWNFRLPYFNICAVALLLILRTIDKKAFIFKPRNFYIPIVFFIAQIFGNDALSETGKLLGAIIYSIAVWLVLSLNGNLQARMFNFIYSKLAIILTISLLTFFLVLLGIPLPDFGRISHPTLDFYRYTNYGVLLYGAYGTRFNSIFCEPGHLGMIAAFLLFINGYNIKNKSTIVLLVSLLCTLSLAGYVLAAIGFILLQMKRNFKTTLSHLVKVVLLFIAVYLFTSNYNNGNNLMNELIFSRLEYDSQEGTIAGNNRASNSLKQYYENLTPNEFLFGIGSKRYSDEASDGLLSGAGYQLFIVIYGIAGIIAVLLFYLSIIYSNNKSVRTEYFFLLVLYALCFVQRSYPFWASEIFTFILANGGFQNRINFTKPRNEHENFNRKFCLLA